MLDAAAIMAAGDPEVVVVSLGTNDYACARNAGREAMDQKCGGPLSWEQLEEDARAMRELFGADVCYLATTQFRPQEEVGLPNELVHDMLEEGSIDAIVDWRAYLASVPGGLDAAANALVEDDAAGHVNPQGAAAYARVVADAVDGACR